MGRLRYVPPDPIDAAYASGVLKADDLLLTDAVPAEVAYVAGIILLAPSAPNAHTAIPAMSASIPFVFIIDPGDAKDLAGKEIVLRASQESGECRVALVDVDGELSAAEKEQLLALKKPEDLGIQLKQPLSAVSASYPASATFLRLTGRWGRATKGLSSR